MSLELTFGFFISHDVFLNVRIQEIELPLDVEGQPEGRDNTAIGADVVKLKTPSLAVSKPLLADFVAAHLVGPDGFVRKINLSPFLSFSP